MDALINGYDDQTLPLAQEALHALAAELPLEVILLELRRVYRAVGDDPSTQNSPDYQQICHTYLCCLDAALWKLETDAG